MARATTSPRHCWGRQVEALSPVVVLLPPQYHAKRDEQACRLRTCALRLEKKIGDNKAAAANRLGRIIWHKNHCFRSQPDTQGA